MFFCCCYYKEIFRPLLKDYDSGGTVKVADQEDAEFVSPHN